MSFSPACRPARPRAWAGCGPWARPDRTPSGPGWGPYLFKALIQPLCSLLGIVAAAQIEALQEPRHIHRSQGICESIIRPSKKRFQKILQVNRS